MIGHSMQHRAPVDHPIHDYLRDRFSPYVFDPHRSVGESELRSLFEAARWTMSCFNEQPWRYIVGVRERDEPMWARVLDCLVPGNQEWARYAPVLGIGIVEDLFEKNGKPNRSAQHDLGAASASLTFEAMSRGLFVHQMAGIQRDRVRETFGLTDTMTPCTGIAIGYHGDPAEAPEKLVKRESGERRRMPIEDFLWRGSL